MKTEYRGVDVSKQSLEVDGLTRPVKNQEASIRAWLAALPPDVHLVCESSGGYEQTLLRTAWQVERKISVVMPRRVRAYAVSCGQHAKTDRLDSALLSKFGAERRPCAAVAPNLVRQRLRELLRAREHILALQLLEQNYREHLPEQPVIRQGSDARLRAFAADLQALGQQIETLIKGDASARREIARLRQVKGVGKITAWTVWADLPELGRLEPGQAAALCGLAPYPDDSATRQGPRHIQHGRATLRRVLYMSALTASRHNPVLQPAYAALRARGKPAKVALIAIARRIIEVLNRLLKDPNFLLAS
jgi:transposase